MVSALLPLHANGITVRRRGKTLLGPVDLTLIGSGVTVVLGPNGAGKTTFLKALYGMERLSAGEVTWSVPETEARERQAFVFQTPILLRRSVAGNLAYPLTLKKCEKAQVATQVADWAKRIGLSHALEQRANLLSGGEKQKLALARALIGAPDLLFLDEPCTNLDGRATREIEALLCAAVEAGTRIVLATHDLGQARRLGTEVLFLKDGQIHESGQAEACFAAPQTAALGAFLKGDIVE
ncbi:MAG: ATP-binding cassette domain-containing protein [Sulfitobacter sp.]